jgi:hypothetical protein
MAIKLSSKSSNPCHILEEAYQYIVENTFQKLSLLHPSSGDLLREIQAVLSAGDAAQMNMDFDAKECNPQAMKESVFPVTDALAQGVALHFV